MYCKMLVISDQKKFFLYRRKIDAKLPIYTIKENIKINLDEIAEIIESLSSMKRDQLNNVRLDQALPNQCNPDGTKTYIQYICHNGVCKKVEFRQHVKECVGV